MTAPRAFGISIPVFGMLVPTESALVSKYKCKILQGSIFGVNQSIVVHLFFTSFTKSALQIYSESDKQN